MRKKILFFTPIRTACFALFFSYIFMTPTSVNFLESQHKALLNIYPRLTNEIFMAVVNECYAQKISYVQIFALVKHESNFTVMATHHNKNGTTDYGLMQINSINYNGDLNDLFDLRLNVKLGISIYKRCYIAAKGDMQTAFRFYNAGQNSKPETYENWEYVRGIMGYIQRAADVINQFYKQCF